MGQRASRFRGRGRADPTVRPSSGQAQESSPNQKANQVKPTTGKSLKSILKKPQDDGSSDSPERKRVQFGLTYFKEPSEESEPSSKKLPVPTTAEKYEQTNSQSGQEHVDTTRATSVQPYSHNSRYSAPSNQLSNVPPAPQSICNKKAPLHRRRQYRNRTGGQFRGNGLANRYANEPLPYIPLHYRQPYLEPRSYESREFVSPYDNVYNSEQTCSHLHDYTSSSVHDVPFLAWNTGKSPTECDEYDGDKEDVDERVQFEQKQPRLGQSYVSLQASTSCYQQGQGRSQQQNNAQSHRVQPKSEMANSRPSAAPSQRQQAKPIISDTEEKDDKCETKQTKPKRRKTI